MLQGDKAATETSPRHGSGWGVVALGCIAALAWSAFFLMVLPHPTGPEIPLPWLRMALGLMLPLFLICLATALAHNLHKLRVEADALRAELDGLRAPPPETAAAPKRETEGAPAATEPGAPYLAQSAEQDSLPLDAAPGPQLSLPDLIRALHFPETPDDKQGFRALSLALKDHRARLVVRAAQDMLTLLSQDGIYVDDLDPTLLPPDAWRRYAGDGRHHATTELSLFAGSPEATRCATRLQENTVFRDTTHHFLRRFDQLLAEQVPGLNDDAITALTATRSARAFLLLGAAAGMFEPG